MHKIYWTTSRRTQTRRSGTDPKLHIKYISSSSGMLRRSICGTEVFLRNPHSVLPRTIRRRCQRNRKQSTSIQRPGLPPGRCFCVRTSSGTGIPHQPHRCLLDLLLHGGGLSRIAPKLGSELFPFWSVCSRRSEGRRELFLSAVRFPARDQPCTSPRASRLSFPMPHT